MHFLHTFWYTYTSHMLILSEMVKLTDDVLLLTCFSVAGEDYSLVPNPVVLMIPTTVIEGMEIFKYITIIEDMALEGDHSFTINILSTSPNISRGSPSKADITIADNDG